MNKAQTTDTPLDLIPAPASLSSTLRAEEHASFQFQIEAAIARHSGASRDPDAVGGAT